MTNFRKRTRTLKPQHDDDGVKGRSHAVGHVHEGYGVGLHVYDVKEPDRPATVLIDTPEDAREVIAMMTSFLASVEGA